jgi:hypothetical protein
MVAFYCRPSAASAGITRKLAVTSDWKAFHSMAFNGFRLRKILLFLGPELVTLVSRKWQNNDLPSPPWLLVHVLHVLWVGYEISGWMVPIDSQAKYSLKRSWLRISLIPAQLSARHTIFQAANKAVAQAPRVDCTKPRVIC